jgi:hypothetical protein
MRNYTAAQIRTMVESLGRVYDIPSHEFMLTHGTAMVVHGLRTTTKDMDITVNTTVFDKLVGYIGATTDIHGQVIWLPGAIEIRPLKTLRTPSFFENLNGCRVQSLQSLLETYQSLQAEPLPGRDKGAQDGTSIDLCVARLAREANEIARDVEMTIRSVGDDLITAIMTMGGTDIWAKINGTVSTTIKDATHSKWHVTFNATERCVDIYEVSEIDMNGRVEGGRVSFTKRLITV